MERVAPARRSAFHQLRSYVSCNKPSFDARHRGPAETLVFGCFRRATTHAHTSGQQTARTEVAGEMHFRFACYRNPEMAAVPFW